MRRALLALLVVLVVLAGGAGALLATGRLPTGQRGEPAAAATPTPSLPGPSPSPAGDVLPPLAAGAPLPGRAALARALDPLMTSPAFGTAGAGASVLDARTGAVLYERDAARPRTPASVTKLATALAVLQGVGPDARLRTRVVAGASPGEVVLVGAGDPTLTAQPVAVTGGASAPASLVELADATAAALSPLAPAAVRVSVDDTLFSGPAASPTWPASYVAEGIVAPVQALAVDEGRVDPRSTGQAARVADPALDAGRRFAALLAARGLPVSTTVTREPAPESGPRTKAWVVPRPASPTQSSDVPSETPAASGAADLATRPGAVIASVDSPPMSVLVGHMLRISDDDLAEALGRIAALATGRPGSFDGASQALLAVLGQGAGQLHDASGLSRQNAISPQAVARLLARAATAHVSDAASQTPPGLPPGTSSSSSSSPSPSASTKTGAGGGMRPLAPEVAAALLDGLPVAGFTGTLDDRFAAGDGAGAVRAKTGTLTGVSSLAGQVVDADGRLLVFAVLGDTVTDTLGARAALDRTAADLAGCGCR